MAKSSLLGLICLLALSTCARRSPSPQAAAPSPTSPARPALDLPVRSGALRFEHFSLEQGLSESVVWALLQDRAGFLWIGTEDGLNRYDGIEFTIFKHDPAQPGSLSQNKITALYEDRTGSLWVGTASGGLNRFQGASGDFVQYFHDAAVAGSLSSNRITAIVEDAGGTLWVGTADGGLNRYNRAAGDFTSYRYSPSDASSLGSDAIAALCADRQGMLWIAAANGLDRFDPAAGQFTHFRNVLNDPNSLSSNQARAVYEDRQGMLWVGTDNAGLNRFDRAAGQFKRYVYDANNRFSLGSNRVSAIYEDAAGVLWVGTLGGGLNQLDRQADQFTRYQTDNYDPRSLSDNRVTALYEDRSGVLWIGAHAGLNKLEQGYRTFEHWRYRPETPDSLGGSQVLALFADGDGTFWIGTDGAGLDHYDPRSGRFVHYQHQVSRPTSLSSNIVQAIYRDRSGALWVGTANGLNRLDAGGAFARFASDVDDVNRPLYASITAIVEDEAGNLWLASAGDGLSVFDPQQGVFLRFYYHTASNPASLGADQVWALRFDSSGTLWVGTAAGLDRFDPAAGQFIHYQNDPKQLATLSGGEVFSLFEDREGNLWVGTNAGLNRFEAMSGGFRAYREGDGLPNDIIYAMVQDAQGFLWLSTNRGLSRFYPPTETFANYDVRDGLQSNEFRRGAACLALDGRVAFGGINGVTAFYPQRLRYNPYIPQVVLTSLSAGGEKNLAANGSANGLANPPRITLRWPDNTFEFAFAALDFTRPEKNQYAYRLDPFDKTWNAIGVQRNGRYTNLPGGTYTLSLKGSNNDGAWSEPQVAATIEVIPPLWDVWWFRSLGVGLLLLGGLGAYRWRLKSIERRNRELERQVEERAHEIEQLFEQTKELAVVEERNRLARDLHDSAKQKAFAALAQLGAAQAMIKKTPLAAKDHLDEAENLVYQVIQELTFLIQEMYPIALKEKGLAAVLRDYAYEWESQNDLPAALTIINERPLPLQIEQAFYRIAQESLANVVRHSRASRVEIRLIYTPEAVELSVADDGCGFNLEQKPAGVGLRSMRDRAALIHGSLEIQSAPGRGAQIILRLPAEAISSFPTP